MKQRQCALQNVWPLRFGLVLLAAALAASASQAQAVPGEGPAHEPMISHHEIVEQVASEELSLHALRSMGFRVFTTPFNVYDGLGDGPFDPAEIVELPIGAGSLGKRPTLQGNGLWLRTNGLDAQSCNECHTIVSNRTRPPTLGFGGVGGAVQNAVILPSVIDVADSADHRTGFAAGHEPALEMAPDGIADFNGRFANPPFLFGGGGVELLAKEMTSDLQSLLRSARQFAPGTTTRLVTHGIDFGSIKTLAAGEVELSLDGIGPKDLEAVPAEEALVVRPFGRKGENFSMRDFDRGAMRFHFGIQPVEVFGQEADEDGDGVVDEVTIGEMTALHVFDVTNRPPRPAPGAFPLPEEQPGFRAFRSVGCSECHVPALETRSRFLTLAHPEVAENPAQNVYLEIDLVAAGFRPAPGGGVWVQLFADLKRHRMGDRLAESFEYGDLHNDEFTTARLWGIADTAPYLHDGRATTLYQAIEMHGGEGQAARDAFLALPFAEQEALLGFLRTLRTPVAPNVELLPRRPATRAEPAFPR